jgi:localization factor PodJL
MKLGVPWTSRGKKGPERSAPNDDADAASVHERLDDLTRQLERLSRITAGKVRPARPATQMAARERTPAYQAEAAPEPAAIEDVAPGPEVARFAGDRTLNRSPLRPVYGGGGLDQALAEIAARQRVLDGEGQGVVPRPVDMPRPMTPPSQNLSGLDEQLRKITTQIESLRPSPADDAMPALRDELAEISRSLVEAMPRRAIEALETEVRGLAERLDQSRQSGVDGAALANLERGLAEVREALASLRPAESLVGFQTAIQGLSRKIDSLVAHHQDPAVLQQLESAITGLRGIVAHVASDDTLARLTEEVRGIAVRLERSSGGAAAPESLASIERQIGAIAEAIDRNQAQGRQVPANIESTLRGLAEAVEKLQLSRGDTIAFGQLEDRITKLVEKLDASGSRFNHLEAIERGLADILVHFEEQRARLRAAGNDPAAASLKRELDVVNETLNRLVDRLAVIETGIRSGGHLTAAAASVAAANAPPVRLPETAAAAPPSPAPVPPAASLVVPIKAPVPAAAVPTLAAKPVAPPSERLAAAAAQAQRPAAPRERSPIDPTLPPDHPLEPGAARLRTGQSPTDRIAASEAALGPAKPPVIPDPAGKTNFVAAARRAAQTAQRLPAAPGAKDAAGPDAAAKPSLRQRLTGRIRSLLVGASVVFLAIAAARIGMMLLDSYMAETPAAKPAAQASSAAPPTKSTARIITDATVTGSTREEGNARQHDADGQKPDNSTGMPDAPREPTQPPSDITGSIPTGVAAADEAAAVPLPPQRPSGEAVAEPATRLAAAAAAGDPAAAYELAVRHLDGRGARRSYEDAAQWLTRASKQGLAPAQFRLGSLYEKGLGVRKDLNEAHRLYSAAAAKGNAKAMHNLAVLHAEGFQGKPDYETAVRWFRKAADHGVADSQYNLGVLYARGVGVEQNLAESFKWFALAAAQGDKDSAAKRDDIASRLDSESLMAARLAVNTWTMRPQPEEAISAKPPAGGWDGEAPPAAPAKRRSRGNTPLKLGPG